MGQSQMQDSNDDNGVRDYGVQSATDAKGSVNESETHSTVVEADGWQQYRRWISKAPAPRDRRSSIDPSLYTWKGYRSWTEQVKRNWTDS